MNCRETHESPVRQSPRQESASAARRRGRGRAAGCRDYRPHARQSQRATRRRVRRSAGNAHAWRLALLRKRCRPARARFCGSRSQALQRRSFPRHVALIAVPELTSRLGAIADRFFDAPSSSVRVLGVTGTNGKTTTAHVLAAALQHLGRVVGLLRHARVRPRRRVADRNAHDARLHHRASPARRTARRRRAFARDGSFLPCARSASRRRRAFRHGHLHESVARPSRLSRHARRVRRREGEAVRVAGTPARRHQR